jgi:acetylglutamate kinase
LTDVDGLYRDFSDKSSLISSLTPEQAEEMIVADVLEGGMVPKVAACVHALRGGVRRAHILNGIVPHALLLEVYTDEGVGTMIARDLPGGVV